MEGGCFMKRWAQLKEYGRDHWYDGVMVIGSLGLSLIIQWLQLGSLSQAVHFIGQRPFYFLVNVLILMVSYSLALLVKRKWFCFALVTFIWGFLAVANAVVLHFRGMPLMFADLFLIGEAAKLIDLYFTPMTMGLFIAVIVLLFVGMAFLFKVKASVKKRDYLLFTTMVIPIIYGLYGIEKQGIMPPDKVNYVKSYDQYGFAYSVVNSIYPYVQGEQKQNKEHLEALANDLQSYLLEEVQVENPTNVVMIQLESFMDPLEIEGVTYSEDPIATFRSLSESYPSGTMVVPTFGAGTVRTEFEALTSISMSAFKPGANPYDEILGGNPVQSLATIFNEKGHRTTFLHNYEGNFYNRHFVVSQLGFKTYVPLEYMVGDHGPHVIDETDDALLVDYIIKTMEKDEAPDFIYAVTAGTHQPYSLTDGETSEITVKGKKDKEELLPLQDYANRMHSLDVQIKRLVEYIDTLSEPTVVVMFGDHLPNLSLVTNEKTYAHDLYETPYLIYSNTELQPVAPFHEMTAYQLGSYLLQLLGMPDGAMNSIHKTYATTEEYQQILDLVQFDLLKGDGQFYQNKILPYTSYLFFGLDELKIDSVETEDELLIIRGDGFSSESRVYLDGEPYSTTYVSPQELQVVGAHVDYQLIEIKQHSGLDQTIGQGAQYEKEVSLAD